MKKSTIINSNVNQGYNVLGLRLSQTTSYDELSLSGSNRLPLNNRMGDDGRIFWDIQVLQG